MESGLSRTGDVELGADEGFQTRWWRIQRVCWVLMLIAVAAGLAGLLGRGPLSKATQVAAEGNVQVRYERLARFQSPTDLEVRLNEQAVHSHKVTIRLSSNLVDRLGLQRIEPQPQSAEPVGDGVRFTFRIDPSPGQAIILFKQKPTIRGWVEGAVQVNDQPPICFGQFIFP